MSKKVSALGRGINAILPDAHEVLSMHSVAPSSSPVDCIRLFFRSVAHIS